MTNDASSTDGVPAPRPFRFGVQCSAAANRADWVGLAARVEELGYSTLTMPDHFGDQLAPMPALQCAADATTRLRVGALVFDNDYKHPAILAKELATMDVLTDGRIEVGLGAGWMLSDYEQLGLPYDPAGVRVTRFTEGLAIIRSAFSPGAFSFDGEHYTVTDYDGLPKPVQQLPPVLVGGGGPRVLKIAAEHADIVGVNGNLKSGKIDLESMMSMTEAEVERRVGWVRTAAANAGRADAIEMSIRTFFVQVTDNPAEAVGNISSVTKIPAEEIAKSPYALIGPPDKLIEDLSQRRERWGFSYIIVGQAEMEAFAPVVAALSGN